MRNKLAHAFEHIDHGILWDTVNNQFPTLEGLLGVLQFNRIVRGVCRCRSKPGCGVDCQR